MRTEVNIHRIYDHISILTQEITETERLLANLNQLRARVLPDDPISIAVLERQIGFANNQLRCIHRRKTLLESMAAKFFDAKEYAGKTLEDALHEL